MIVTLDFVEIEVADAKSGWSLDFMAGLSDQWIMKKSCYHWKAEIFPLL